MAEEDPTRSKETTPDGDVSARFFRKESDGHIVPLSGVSKWVYIRHQENVYSYFKFICPVEDKKSRGRLTYTKALAYVLVIGSIFLQFTLLYAIFDRIVYGDIEWQNQILNPSGESFGDREGGGAWWNPFEAAPAGCNPGGSLCFKMHGTVTCAPPTVLLTGKWDELDTNGDGIWTREEVEAAKDDMMCKYAVNPIEVFDVFTQFLLNRESVIWLHPDVKDGKAIPKPYFTYAAGDIIMCGYRTPDMCANLLRNGVFDAPLEKGTAPRVGETINSALDYCYGLLEDGGTCDRTLPSSYAVWRKTGEEQCGAPDFSPYVFTHPVTGKTKSMLTVDYAARQAYSRAQNSELFLVYKSIIIGLFVLAMFAELKDCLNLTNWIIKFPSASEFGEESVLVEKNEDGEVKYTVQGITAFHRALMAVLTFIRYVMLAILMVVGLRFLLKDTTYIDLLLNAVGFVFIVEISNYMYSYFLDPSLQDECEAVEPMQVVHMGPRYLNEHPALRDIFGIFGLSIVVIIIMFTHHEMIVRPLWQALECTCLGEGAKCTEAQTFNKNFWANYWTTDVPSVFDEVNALKAAVEGSNGGTAATVLTAAQSQTQGTQTAAEAYGRANHVQLMATDSLAHEADDAMRRWRMHGHHSKHHFVSHFSSSAGSTLNTVF